ncbi:hypothetical protein BAE44_0014178 [Dichanthelium oligosanthes]|uniref:Uncharacterized protein n=1 Tax=Dichanthelium oligosanthes TaxID=888268 RepID=A0A1E5VID3_9POAL|nr:hypothetical protein BAE44_0014178 [Dichanthelium oligosanthes]
MGPLDVEAGGNTVNADTVTTPDMVEATLDVGKLRRVLVAGGVGQAAAALYMVLFRPPAGLFLLSGSLFRAYYCVLAAIAVLGVAEAWTGLWLSHNDPVPPRRRAVGVAVLWASLLPLLLLAGIGGFAMPTTAPEVAGQMADAAHDDRKLVRALVGGGAAKAVAGLVLALHPSPGGVFLSGGSAMFYAYYGILVVVALFGALEVAVGLWVSGDPDRRRGWGRLAMWVSVVPLVFVAGMGGFAVRK